METSHFDPRQEVLQRIGFARTLFGADVAAMSDDRLRHTCGGASRCGYDFMFELTGFFETFAGILESGPSAIAGPNGEWLRAPEEFKDKTGAMTALAGAADRFESALSAYQGDIVNDEYPSPVGPFTPLRMGNLAVWHMMYHSGQPITFRRSSKTRPSTGSRGRHERSRFPSHAHRGRPFGR